MNKTTLKKLLISIILVVMLSNFMISNIVLAEETAGEQVENVVVAGVNVLEDFLGGVMGSVVGLLTKPFRALALALANALDGLTADIAYSQGAIDENGVIRPDTFFTNESITPFDIFFNRVALVDVNFFNIPQEESIIKNVRVAIAGWYYVMRNIAASILLCVLIYVGIRMALSTVASDKASYKKMLVDWVCSLALIFLIQYIIIFTFSVNEALISALKSVAGEDATDLVNAMEAIKRTAKNWITLDSIPATIVYCMLVGQTLSLLMSYFNRMLKIAFLIIISPLITLTYSIDKMGDGKAQALGTWLKEFVYTVLIQTFHCIIYMVFMGMAISILNSGIGESYNLAGSWLAVICVKFTKDAEKLLGKIFKFGDSTSDTSIAAGMMLSAAALQNATKIGKGTVKAANGVRSLKSNLSGRAHDMKVGTMTLAATLSARLNGEKDIDREQIKADAEEKVTMAEADKAEKKAGKKYNAKESEKGHDKKYDEKVDELAAKLKKDNPEISDGLAKARARSQIAEKTRAEKKKSDFEKKHKHISKVTGTIGEMKGVVNEVRQSDLYKLVAGDMKKVVSGGAALFVGATLYGMNGDAFKSMAAAGTMYKGSQEVFKNSAKEMVDQTSANLRGLEIKSDTDAKLEMQRIQAMSPILSDKEELDKYLEDLLRFVDQNLKNVDPEGKESKKIKTAIKNTVQREIKNNPEIGMESLKQKIASNFDSYDVSENAKKEFNKIPSETYDSAITNVANTNRRKEIYDQMQNASDLNIAPGTFANMVGKRFPSDAEITEKVDHSKQIDRNDKKYEKEYESYDYDKMSDEEQKASVERIEEIARENQAMRDEMFTDSTKEMKALYEELKSQLESDAEEMKQEAIRELKILVDRFEKEKEEYSGQYVIPITRRDQKNGIIDKEPIDYVSKNVMKSADELIAEMKSNIPTNK